MAGFLDDLIIPTCAEDIDDSWRQPLTLAAELVADDPTYALFDPDDFMIMYKVRRDHGSPLVAYKHYWTRGYLHLDDQAGAYRYVPPDDIMGDDPGTYLKHRCLEDGIDALGLWELPWMKPGLEHERHGLSVADRWQAAPAWPPARRSRRRRGRRSPDGPRAA